MYERFINERFERCLDLYLAPRARKMRLTIQPEDLVPQLPKPHDLQVNFVKTQQFQKVWIFPPKKNAFEVRIFLQNNIKEKLGKTLSHIWLAGILYDLKYCFSNLWKMNRFLKIIELYSLSHKWHLWPTMATKIWFVHWVWSPKANFWPPEATTEQWKSGKFKPDTATRLLFLARPLLQVLLGVQTLHCHFWLWLLKTRYVKLMVCFSIFLRETCQWEAWNVLYCSFS